jgi:hypothetical protein
MGRGVNGDLGTSAVSHVEVAPVQSIELAPTHHHMEMERFAKDLINKPKNVM